MAVVLVIVALLMGGMMFTFSAQVDQSNQQETTDEYEPCATAAPVP